MLHLKVFFTLFVASFFIQSCQNSQTSYREKVDIEGMGWQESQHIKFDNVVINEGEELLIRVSHRDNYEFENIYLHTTIYQDTSKVHEDSFSVPLTNGQGQWLGKAQKGLRQKDYSINQNITSQKPLQVIIAQYSREPVLKGIEQIELIVQKK